MHFPDICELKKDICSLDSMAALIAQTTAVEIFTDMYGNLSINDPFNELDFALSGGNASGSGSKADSFEVSNNGNFIFNPF
jgi:hypothetical protein